MDIHDVVRIMHLAIESGHSSALKTITEEMYQLIKKPLKDTDKDEIYRVLIDYYALVEHDFSIALSLSENLPSATCATITLLSLKCIQMAIDVSKWYSVYKGNELRTIQKIEDILKNPAIFADVITLLKKSISMHDYGQVTKVLSDSESESDSPNDTWSTGIKRKRSAAYHERATTPLPLADVTLPTKREISSVLSTLGTAVRSFIDRQQHRSLRSGSDMSASSSVTSDAAFRPEPVRTENHKSARVSDYTVDVHTLCACYIHGAGASRDGLSEMRRMIEINEGSSQSHEGLLRYLCQLHADRRSDIRLVVSKWAKSDPHSTEALYLSILLMKIDLLDDNMNASTINSQLLLVRKRCQAIELVANFIEVMPSFQNPLLKRLSYKPILLHEKDLIFPYFHYSVHVDKELQDITCDSVRSIITSWNAWKALASLLGPVHGQQCSTTETSTIQIAEDSEYGKILLKARISPSSPLLEVANISLCRSKNINRGDTVVRHFTTSRGWWTNVYLSHHSLPTSGVDKETMSRAVNQRMWLNTSNFTYTVNQALDWIHIDSSCYSGATNLDSLWKEVVRIGTNISDGDGFNMADWQDGENSRVITVDALLKEILCFQTVVCCHLHSNCQDNLFIVQGINFLLHEKSLLSNGGLADLTVLKYLTAMKIDVVRALRLSDFLINLVLPYG